MVAGRRNFLAGICAFLFGCTLEPLARGAPVPGDNSGNPRGAPPDDSDERLRRELARIESREYGEEGTPMFLACENLAPDGAVSFPDAYRPGALNAQLASEYRELAAMLADIRPDAVEYDAATLVVLLADRDFNAGSDGVSR